MAHGPGTHWAQHSGGDLHRKPPASEWLVSRGRIQTQRSPRQCFHPGFDENLLCLPVQVKFPPLSFDLSGSHLSNGDTNRLRIEQSKFFLSQAFGTR